MELWRHVAENLISIINSEENEKCLQILSLSYNNLPIHLKPCFLYLATVPVSRIHFRLLIHIWVSVGILKPIRTKSLEEAAYEYITELVDRNLIFVRERGILGQFIWCDIHDLLRDLCLREAEKVDFCSVIDAQNPDIPVGSRHLGFHQAPLKRKRSIPHVHGLLGPTSLIRSIIGELDSTPLCATNLRLLRVLLMSDSKFPNDIVELINLRFILLNGEGDWNSVMRFISSISLFWNLQTLLIFNSLTIFLPPEIWCLPHLRHLMFNRCVLPDPPCYHIDKHDSHILENLQTLCIVLFFRCTEEVCRRLPNLKELQVTYDPLSPGVEWPFFRLHNLVHLHKLQSLTFQTYSPISSKYLSFPLSLKELTLSRCRLPWEDMTVVSSLPNLVALHLLTYAFEGKTWLCPIEEGQFVTLKVLKIGKTDLLYWRADKTHFPILEHLILQKLNLEEFPENFGQHPTLESIVVVSCSDSTNAWAEQIREEQESFGNDGFRVIVREIEDDD